MSEKEIQEKLINYLLKKGISTKSDGYTLYWKYEKYYSKFSVRLYFGKKKYYDDQINIITYDVGSYIRNLSKRRTSIKTGFCLKVYKNIVWIKEKLDEIAENEKIKTEEKKRYCTELEMYYKNIYKIVYISTSKTDEIINISVNAYDEFNNNAQYNIIYTKNRYYLISKKENLEKVIEL